MGNKHGGHNPPPAPPDPIKGIEKAVTGIPKAMKSIGKDIVGGFDKGFRGLEKVYKQGQQVMVQGIENVFEGAVFGIEKGTEVAASIAAVAVEAELEGVAAGLDEVGFNLHLFDTVTYVVVLGTLTAIGTKLYIRSQRKQIQ